VPPGHGIEGKLSTSSGEQSLLTSAMFDEKSQQTGEAGGSLCSYLTGNPD